MPAWIVKVHAPKIMAIDLMPLDLQIRMTLETGQRIQEEWFWYTEHLPSVGDYYIVHADDSATCEDMVSFLARHMVVFT